MLNLKDFETVVKLTPLISIDLIVRDTMGRVLVGLRSNKPAQNFLFLPGGAIRKNEKFYDEALWRIALKEIGIELRKEDVTPLGLYRHSYSDNFSGGQFGTDYFACGIQIKKPIEDISKIKSTEDKPQHSKWLWLSVSDLLNDKRVHRNTKAYFQDKPDNLIFRAED